jgi:hypothetical protein
MCLPYSQKNIKLQFAYKQKMVKHPQWKLGYAVDGQVVRLPVRRPIIDDSQDESKFFRSKSMNQKAHKKKKNRRNHNPESGGIRGLRNKLSAFADELEDLRNYSKQGRIDDACTLAATIAYSYFGRNPTDQTFQLMVRCLVAPGIENRSALYHAAHAGHVSMVRTYLALLVLSRSTRSHVRDIESSRTFASWICEFGYIEFFGHREYNACILNALNGTTKAVFTVETYSLEDIQKIVLRSPWREHLPKIANTVVKKARKPRLQMEDEYVLNHFSPGLCSKHGLSNNLDRLSARSCSNEELSHLDFYRYDDYVDDDTHDDEGVESTTVIDDLDEYIILQLILTEEANKSDVAFPAIGEDPSDHAWIDDWSDVHTTTSGVAYHGDVTCGDGDDWSILSEIASVKSISSAPFSYSDALRFGRKGTMESIVENRFPSSAGEGESKGGEGDDVDAYDAFFIRDGIKDCHGGKAVLRFKANRTNKQWWHGIRRYKGRKSLR